MMAVLNRLWKDESGQGMVEYGLIIALVSVAVIGVLGLMGEQIKHFFQQITGKLGEHGAPTE